MFPELETRNLKFPELGNFGTCFRVSPDIIRINSYFFIMDYYFVKGKLCE